MGKSETKAVNKLVKQEETKRKRKTGPKTDTLKYIWKALSVYDKYSVSIFLQAYRNKETSHDWISNINHPDKEKFSKASYKVLKNFFNSIKEDIDFLNNLPYIDKMLKEMTSFEEFFFSFFVFFFLK